MQEQLVESPAHEAADAKAAALMAIEATRANLAKGVKSSQMVHGGEVVRPQDEAEEREYRRVHGTPSNPLGR